MTKAQIKDMLWHGGKALLCALQLCLLDVATNMAAASLTSLLLQEYLVHDKYAPFIALVHPAVTVILFFVLWRYYDTIDDRSFNRFCTAPEAPEILRDPGYLTGLALTVLTVTPIIVNALYRPCTLLGLGSGWSLTVSVLISLAVTAGGSVLRLMRLEFTWSIQQNLRTGKEKHKLSKRILYAVIFFVALYLIILLGSSVGVAWGSVIITVVKLLFGPVVTVSAIVLAWSLVVNPLRLIHGRRKFLRRLRRLQERGELSMKIHGHPYLSVFSERIPFGLTITDAPHPDAKAQVDTTYLVTFANCKRRRGTVILCDRNIYQFLYTFQFNHITRFSHMGAASSGALTISVPGASWFTSHSFVFPEGEGQRILLIDPTPHILAIRGTRDGELIPQDNASQVFGYTVYGKNSFVNMLERT